MISPPDEVERLLLVEARKASPVLIEKISLSFTWCLLWGLPVATLKSTIHSEIETKTKTKPKKPPKRISS